MLKRIVQKEQAKCNFCMNWFAIYSEIKFGLNICQSCIYKALTTNSFKLPTPQGQLYQVYLAKRHISMGQQTEDPNLQIIDEFMHSQLKGLLKKWEQIASFIKKLSKDKMTENGDQWKQIEFILKNDMKKFQNNNIQTIQQITEDIEEIKPATQAVNSHRTPLKQKTITTNKAQIDLSVKKTLNRNLSKKSLKLNGSSSKKSINLQDLSICPNQYSPSPFTLQSSSRVSSKSRISVNIDLQLEGNREFQAQMQAMKTTIMNNLEKKFGSKLVNLQNIKKEKIFQTIQNTTNLNKCIQLVSYKLPNEDEFDMQSYLNSLDWEGVEVAKFVRVGLTDDKVRDILECLSDKNIETLVLTNNSLTQQSIHELTKWKIPSIKNIYIGKNNILPIKVRKQLGALRKNYRIFV